MFDWLYAFLNPSAFRIQVVDENYHWRDNVWVSAVPRIGEHFAVATNEEDINYVVTNVTHALLMSDKIRVTVWVKRQGESNEAT